VQSLNEFINKYQIRIVQEELEDNPFLEPIALQKGFEYKHTMTSVSLPSSNVAVDFYYSIPITEAIAHRIFLEDDGRLIVDYIAFMAQEYEKYGRDIDLWISCIYGVSLLTCSEVDLEAAFKRFEWIAQQVHKLGVCLGEEKYSELVFRTSRMYEYSEVV
jgi:hypothetical protein